MSVRMCRRGFRLRPALPAALAWISLLPATATVAGLLLFFVQVVSAQGWQRGDIVLAENPGSFRLYNEYQQPVANPGTAGVSPFAPILILSPSGTLSDGLTPCVTVEIAGRRFYLIKDPETLTILGARGAGATTILRRTTPIRDTLIVLTAGTASFAHPGTGVRSGLPPGTRVERMFMHENRTYARIPGNPASYGWFSLEGAGEGREWIKVRSNGARVTRGNEPLVKAVNERLTIANKLFAELYTFFGERTGVRHPPPVWRVESTDMVIVCLLTPQPRGGAKESTRLLAHRIENVTLGSEYRVIWSPGRIEISR